MLLVLVETHFLSGSHDEFFGMVHTLESGFELFPHLRWAMFIRHHMLHAVRFRLGQAHNSASLAESLR